MPQLNNGGKFVFGLSVIHENRSVQIPPQAINEYRLSNENNRQQDNRWFLCYKLSTFIFFKTKSYLKGMPYIK